MSLASIRTQALEIFGGFYECLEKFFEPIDLSYQLIIIKVDVGFATFTMEATLTPNPFNRQFDLATALSASDSHKVVSNRVFGHGLS